MSQPRDPPIEPLEYLGGVKVVDLGDIRVARGLTRRPYTACRHRALRYDPHERRIWCADCESNIEGFDAFTLLVEQYNDALGSLRAREERVKTAEESALISIAAREVDLVWRGRRMVPTCPSCGKGLFPEDFKNGFSTQGREYARAQRDKQDNSP